MRHIETVATTLAAYELDRKHWHKPGRVVIRSDVYMRITGAQITADDPLSTVTATAIGHNAIVVTVEPSQNVQREPETAQED